MNRTRSIAGIAAAAAAIAAPAAFAGTSHVKLWQNAAGTVTCGLEQPLPHKLPSLVLCSGYKIPKPKGTPKTAPGDPFVQIGRTGKPKLVLISQASWVTNNSQLLYDGTTWSSLGVTCKLGHTVKCTNTSGHGFKTGNGSYKSF